MFARLAQAVLSTSNTSIWCPLMIRKWKVQFIRRGWEPPYPFGKTHEIVEASSRSEAIEAVKR